MATLSSFKDKVVLVTGACGGMGSEISRAFAQRQANLVLVDLDQKQLEATAKACREIATIDVIAIKADLTVQADLESVVEKTLSHFKKIDVLVNNAGIMREQRVTETSWEDYDKMMNINLKAPFFLVKGFLEELRKTKGSIVNISSVAGKFPVAIYSSYCLSKSALNSLTQLVAQENARFGVRVNSVNPGTTDTNLTGTNEKPALARLLAKPTQPLGGLIDPKKIALWVVHLASEEAGPITGQNIGVDGACEVTRIPLGFQIPKTL